MTDLTRRGRSSCRLNFIFILDLVVGRTNAIRTLATGEVEQCPSEVACTVIEGADVL